MTSVDRWLSSRRPEPPDALAPRLRPADAAGGDRVESLARAARASLDRACATPGPVREAAFDLLAADALFTYACEAALESAAPAEALERILQGAADR